MAASTDSAPAVPAPAALVRDFVNTTDHELGTDDLDTAAGLRRYLVAQGLMATGSRVSAADLALARGLRAGLRRALERNHDEVTEVGPQLRVALRGLPVGLDWAEDAVTVRATAAGVRGALARLGIAALDSAVDGTWARLKICSSDECEWAYYDHSKNRSRAWCEYGCGNRIKTRAYRARRRVSG